MCRYVLDESIESALHGYSSSVSAPGGFEPRYPLQKTLKQHISYIKNLRIQNAMTTWSVSQTLQHT